MGLFSKKEKKLIEEMDRKNMLLGKETLGELEELYDDLVAAYEHIDSLTDEYIRLADKVMPRLDENDKPRLQHFTQKLNRAEKASRNAVRDMRDILRNQKKRLKEALREI